MEDKAPSTKIVKIMDRQQLVDLAKAFGVSEEWHATSSQGLSCKVFGESFDNAGFWGRDINQPPEFVELYATLYKDKIPVAEVNLATLFGWASIPSTNKGQEIMLDDDHVFLNSDFIDWLFKLYPGPDPAVCSFYKADYLGQLPSLGFVFIQHSDSMYFLYIPQATDPRFQLLPVMITEPTDELPGQVTITEREGHLQIFDILKNVDEILEDLSKDILNKFETMTFSEIQDRWGHVLDFPEPKDLLSSAMDNHRTDVDWDKITDDAGFSVDEILSEYFSAIIQGIPLQINRNSLGDSEMIDIAINHFNLDVEGILKDALEPCSGDDLLSIANDLHITVSDLDRQSIERRES